MNYLRTALLFFSLIGFSQLVSADGHGSEMPTPMPVEFWSCQFNEGKNLNDLQAVIKDWKKAMGKQEYTAWVMTPTFAAENMAGGVGFTGWWPSWTEMGKMLQHTAEKVDPKMDPKWAEVITCDAHMSATGITTRASSEELSKNAIMNYSQCTFKSGKTPEDLLKATMGMNKFLDKIGISNMAAGILFPQVGAPDGFDFANTFWVPNMTAMGELAQKFVSNGGNQVQQELFGEVAACNNGSQFSGSQIY